MKTKLICRLCGDASDSYMNIFGQEGTRHTISEKILSYLKVEVSNSDLLPKVICNVCFHKLEEFHSFFLTSKKIQLLLKNTINESLFSIKIKIGPLTSEISNDHIGSLTSEISNDHIGPSTSEISNDHSIAFDKDDIPFSYNEDKEDSQISEGNSISCSDNDDDKGEHENIEQCENITLLAVNDNENVEYQEITDSFDTKENNIHKNVVDSTCNKYQTSDKTNCLLQNSIADNSFHYNHNGLNLSQNEDLNVEKRLGSLVEPKESWENTCEQKSSRESDTDFMNALIRLPCSLCTEIFMSPKELIEHYSQQHCNETPTFKCYLCGRIYKVLKNFYVHYHNHDNVNKHICKICGKSFTRSRTLRFHASVHTDAKPFKCEECDKYFKSLSSLKNHKKTHLPDECKLIYTCAYCGKSFKSKFILTTHERIHTGQKDFICDICGKSFASHSSLLYHITIHNYSKSIKCHLCNKLIRDERLFKRHLAIHSEKQWKCEYCGKKYHYITQLNEHRRLHTGELPYECEYCKKRFRLNSTLIIHRRQHTGVKPYKCVSCDHSFTNWPNYNKHMKRKHYNTIVREKNDELILLKI